MLVVAVNIQADVFCGMLPYGSVFGEIFLTASSGLRRLFCLKAGDSRVCFKTLCPTELHRATSQKAVIFSKTLYLK